MNSIISIKERFISPQVLPQEQATAWIKWEKGAQFDKIVLKYEADVDLVRLFNVDEEIFKDKDNWRGKVEIPRSMIQMDGFFGFTSHYTLIPNDERKISYSIDFVYQDKTQNIILENTLTRPKLIVIKSSPDQIHLSNTNPPLPPFSVNLRSEGMASIHNLSYFIDFITTDKLKVSITTSRPTISKEMSLKKEQTSPQQIRINGKGTGLIRMGANYYDDYNTKYEDILKEIPLIVDQQQNQTLPISEEIDKRETELLTISK